MPESPDSPQQNPQIQQDINGDRNQTIGQVLGGMVVYGQVIYNNAIAEPPLSSQTEETPIGPNPYKGLLAFHETDGDRFFGRDPQIQELWETFRTLHEAESATRLLTIYGPSGSGKSSLARAGLIPALARRPLPGRDRARVAVLMPGSHPLEALATVLARIATGDATPVAKTREFAAELKAVNSEGIYDGLRRIGDALPEIADKTLIVLVDQLEEVFTLCEDPAERDAFIGNLLCASGDRAKRVSAIVTLRSDFLGATQQYSRLNQMIASQGYFVAAMSPEGLREAITKPVENVGHPLDSSTVDRLIVQTEGREGALPLLQFALTRIWAVLGEGKEPAETLRAIGGVGGALAGEAQRIYESLSSEEQEIARRIFLGLVQLGEGSKDTRRRTELERVVSHRDSLEQVQRVIGRFSAPGARLITLAEDGGTETAEVTHEALFDHWQQMKVWLDGSRSDLRFQRRLDEAAMVWQQNGRPEGNLWRSPDLDLLRRYQGRAGDDMTPLQLEFFQASADAEKAQKQAIERAEKEKKRHQQILAGVMGTGFVLTSVTAIFALFQLQQAQRQRVELLAANAEGLLADNQDVKAVINAIAAKGLSQSAFIQFPKHLPFISAYSSLLDVNQIFNLEKNRLFDNGAVLSVSYSQDCQRFVSGSQDKTLKIWDTTTGALLKTFPGHEAAVWSVSYSPNGEYIVSGSGDKTLKIWNSSTGALIKTLTGHSAEVYAVSYSPNGEYIVSGSADKTLKIWNSSTGALIKTLTGHEKSVNSVSYSPNGEYIVSGSEDETLKIWDTATGVSIKTLTGHVKGITLVSYSPRGQRIVSGSRDKTVKVWDAKLGVLLKTLKGHTDEVLSVLYSPDEKYIVSSSSDKTVRVWDVAMGVLTGKPLQGHEDAVWSVSYCPESHHIISGSRDKTVRIWDARMGTQIGKPLQGHEVAAWIVSYSPDGQQIVGGNENKAVRIWDTKMLVPISKPLQGNEDAINSAMYSPDGRYIVSGSLDKKVRIWDAKNGVLLNTLLGHEDAINSVTYSPDTQHIASGSRDKTVRVWDSKTGARLNTLLGHEDAIRSVKYSPDGKYIVSGSLDKTVRVWNATTGSPIFKMIHNAGVTTVSYSPDGQRIISGSLDKTVRIWDAKMGTPLKILRDFEDEVLSVTYSPDGKYIVSGSADFAVRIWDAITGILIRTLPGHDAAVWSVAYSPDGRYIVSGSADKTIRVWDATTGVPIGKALQGHEDVVWSVAYSPDGQHVLSSSRDKTMRVWTISWESLLQMACNQLRYHPSLEHPANEDASEAKKTCEHYVWKH